MKIASSWSGGKDSCLATYKAMNDGHEVVALLNLASKETKRCCFHGIPMDLINLQANALGIPVFLKDVSPEMDRYEQEFKKAIIELKDKYNIEGMVFGDIYLDEHRDWVERVCKDVGIIALEPLWNRDTNEIIEEFIGSGFKSVIVSAKADLFTSDFIGRTIDRRLAAELYHRNICVCGENGEFHSFVYDGPIFRNRIEITKQDKVLKEGFWKHWFLDIQKYEAKEKASQ